MRKSPPIGKRAGLIHSHTEFGCTVRLHRQLFATAATAGSQNPTTVIGRHAGTEAMHLAALTLLGLVCTEHSQHSSRFRTGSRIRMTRFCAEPVAPRADEQPN